MGTDDSGQNNQNGEPGGPEPEKAEDRANRMNAAKAFYRAMYAGEEVAPDDFGMNTGTGGGGAGGERGHTGPCPNCARLEAQAAEFEKQKNEAENFYKRIAADFENYRRRLDREREEFQGLGVQKAVEQILPALDDMDRARQSLQNVTDPKAILDSLNLVFNRFAKCLESTGVKQMDVIGEPFDPRLHEPVQEVETNEFADGAVVHELRRGYMYKDKVLRPALVNVASNPSGVVVPKAPPPEATAQAAESASTSAASEGAAATQSAQAATAPAQAASAQTASTQTASTQAAPAQGESAQAATGQSAPAQPAASQAAPTEAVTPQPAQTTDATQPTQGAAGSTQAATDAQSEAPQQKAIDKLKPTRPHTETQDLPVFKIDDYAESLAPEPDLEITPELPTEARGGEEGTVYDITDVEVDEKPVGQDEPAGQ